MKDLERLPELHRRVVDPQNCQLSNIEQGGRIAGHVAQVFVGPKVFEALTKVTLRMFGAAKGAQVVAGLEEAAAAKALQAEEAARRAAGAAKAGEFTVQFGKDSNQIYHTFRHTDVLGLNRTVVKSAIETHLANISSQLAPGKPVNQIIEVAGQRIQYTAFKLEDGTINIGRIHGVK